MNESPTQSFRRLYQPKLPFLFNDLANIQTYSREIPAIDDAIRNEFPHSKSLPILYFQKGKSAIANKPLKVGVIFSGGQASGGHNVLSGLWDALKKIHFSSGLIGFLNGPSGLLNNSFIELTEEKIAVYRNQGGFDLIGSGRTKIETEEQFEAVGNTLQKHSLDGLVIVGGDDSNTNAAFLAEYCKKNQIDTQIVGVPKTIDGDLKNEYIEISFGFDTASKMYAEMIGNLAKDALSAKKYTFFVKMMGRSASHLTLECALQTHINLALIGEEIAAKQLTLNDIVSQIADLICERSSVGKDYGVILIPEGLLEFFSPSCFSLSLKKSNSSWQ